MRPTLPLAYFFLAQFIAFSVSAQSLNTQNLLKNEQPAFIENKGQIVDQNGKPRPDVKFVYSGQGFKLTLKDNSFSYELYTITKNNKVETYESSGTKLDEGLPRKFSTTQKVIVSTSRVDIDLPGAHLHPEIIAEGRSKSYANYYLAHTPESGVINIYSYSIVTYRNIYDKIDLVFKVTPEGRLKYDLVMHPGACPEKVKMVYKGLNNLDISNGKLISALPLGKITEEIPESYIQETGERFCAKYRLRKNTLTFDIPDIKGKTLIIDPLLSWSTYYAGPGKSNPDQITSLSTDGTGNVYALGFTSNITGIATSGAYQTTKKGFLEAFLVKFNGSGTRLWCTYYGGEKTDEGHALVTDSHGNSYIAGETWSSTGIATTGAYQTVFGEGYTDGFLAKFDKNGKRTWGTYFGGSKSDQIYGIAVNQSDDIYITGQTASSLLATPGAHQTKLGGSVSNDAFLTKFNSDGVRQWATYCGGNNPDIGRSVATSPDGDVYIVGETQSLKNISTPGSHQPDWTSQTGPPDAFLVKFNSDGVRQWGTYYGGDGEDLAYAIRTDPWGNIYFAGKTTSKYFISTLNSYVYFDAFLAKFNKNGKRIWGRYFGGDDYDDAYALSVDSSTVYLGGNTHSLNGIVTPGSNQPSYGGNNDAFVAKFDSAGMQYWGVYLGGKDPEYGYALTIDKFKNVYLGGVARSDSGVATTDGHKVTYEGDEDGFLAKFRPILDAGVGKIYVAKNHCGRIIDTPKLKITNFGEFVINKVKLAYIIDSGPERSIIYTKSISPMDSSVYLILDTVTFNTGKHTIKAWTLQPNDTIDENKASDTLKIDFFIREVPDAAFVTSELGTKTFRFIPGDTTQKKYKWFFGDGDSSSAIKASHTYTADGKYNVKLSVTNQFGCVATTNQTVDVHPVGIFEVPASSESLYIYPNPFGKFFQLSIPENMGSNVRIDVYNHLGECIYHSLYKSGQNIDLSFAPAGMYTIQLKTDKTINTGRVIKE